ncbi:MAG TPA: Gfo/Idh/MocA family oxidoreductase [Candidatus Hydrogenedentes bacterium]|nr:Gfo/Idh/MocA family oxidoreductase [Candidatus Hydrogenedentota bacterium]HOV75333.1 Gfo/Idh/MocA family oxidoreductase [Candidatus Hydrogenedentota bacterium]HPC17136.1 Gfo/Idh/MocA family oxidoreductase [Candidatus Hydrogenedentota bacterium]HRT21037.1 Gfo/Idh/MocA family oxidoreductase [Candidatus Hydrogenedentota bacterium]HRT65866.1 Gfo/Idh/MocA family oxidoreductase [Candidatus Hydrogenedentota bacterium]
MAAKMDRRTFVRTAAAGVAAGFATGRARGANEKIRLGFIGVGNRGGQLIEFTQKHADAEIVALCDVYDPFLKKWAEKLGGGVRQYRDFRALLEQDSIDAVVVASPDHWHALHTIMACEAGKDVYVEKPLSITIHEGRKIADAAKKTGRIVQVGIQRRSGQMYSELAQRVRDGLIGKVTVARCYRITNMWPNGIGKAQDADPPADLDWDMWLGPRPMRPFRDTIAPYKFRWWQAYSSQVANWGVHFLDVIRWMLGETGPSAVAALGGKFAVDDDRDIPDTMEVTYELPSGALAVFGQYEASGADAMKRGYVELRGTKGTIYMDDRGYEILPERGGQFQDNAPRMEPAEVKSTDGDLSVQHIRNFLDCIKSREQPSADAETGHRSTTFSHLANIALATRSVIEWDADAERITNNDKANALLHYEYRKPWKLA